MSHNNGTKVLYFLHRDLLIVKSCKDVNGQDHFIKGGCLPRLFVLHRASALRPLEVFNGKRSSVTLPSLYKGPQSKLLL